MPKCRDATERIGGGRGDPSRRSAGSTAPSRPPRPPGGGGFPGRAFSAEDLPPILVADQATASERGSPVVGTRGYLQSTALNSKSSAHPGGGFPRRRIGTVEEPRRWRPTRNGQYQGPGSRGPGPRWRRHLRRPVKEIPPGGGNGHPPSTKVR